MKASWLFVYLTLAAGAAHLGHYAVTEAWPRYQAYLQAKNNTEEPCPIGPPSRCIHAREIAEARHDGQSH